MSAEIFDEIEMIESPASEQPARRIADAEQLKRSLSKAQQEALSLSWRVTVSKEGTDDRVRLTRSAKSTTMKLIELGMIARDPEFEHIGFSTWNWRFGGFWLTELGIAAARALNSGITAEEYKRDHDEKIERERLERERESKRREREAKEINKLIGELIAEGVDLSRFRNSNKRYASIPDVYNIRASELLEILSLARAQIGAHGR